MADLIAAGPDALGALVDAVATTDIAQDGRPLSEVDYLAPSRDPARWWPSGATTENMPSRKASTRRPRR